ncbi:uncharacterized protein LOC124491041 [Dermatophagoides farinae]|uniref:Uncharacterized protein n=1 Tax=Dermatophagoides farinae TaxID=6954 RepID=A0A9D4NWZ9_DERFA|nr:uncharacterized protein LOC124491041 [Dermatophagoides farinae]XP_046909597.1 uncharacterized protein LOC124491041 [Dermatophagoides farinae]XP_046909598.1 uncharacterized protein LOC124491041 [Dermatophagoides farinae]KAH7639722.1 hypothetical protein HUG17_3755 [Dermatophagoides farinae]
MFDNYFSTNKDENHLLNWFLFFFGHLGIQLKPIDYRNRKCLIQVMVNILINVIGILYYNQKAVSFWDYDAIKNSQKTAKSLNNFMSLFGNNYIHVFLIINPIVFYCIGPSLNRLMALSPFKNIYRSRKKSIHVLAIMLSTITVNFVGFTIFDGSQNLKKNHTLRTIIFEFFINYYISVSYFIPGLALNYVKFATIEMLKAISATRSERKNIETIIKEIGEMATLNRKISSILSPMFSIFLISTMFDMIVLFMWFSNMGWDFIRIFFASLTTWFYIAYLVRLDNQIIQIFEKISTNLLENNLFECCGHCCNNNRMVEYGYINKKIYFCKQKQRIIECYRLYEEDFRMNIYDFCPVDYQLILDSFLFMLIFVVISLQT